MVLGHAESVKIFISKIRHYVGLCNHVCAELLVFEYQV